jgi:hypothetical protein
MRVQYPRLSGRLKTTCFVKQALASQAGQSLLIGCDIGSVHCGLLGFKIATTVGCHSFHWSSVQLTSQNEPKNACHQVSRVIPLDVLMSSELNDAQMGNCQFCYFGVGLPLKSRNEQHVEGERTR